MSKKVVIGIPESNGDFSRKFLDERENLAGLIESEGFEVMRVRNAWPKNLFVNFRDKVITAKEHGLYGNGGVAVSCPEFVIASADISGEQPVEIRVSTLNRLYGKGNYEIITPLYGKHIERLSFDIDCEVLPLPQIGRLVVGRDYHALAASDIQRIADRRGLSLDLVANTKYFPCNTLILEDDKHNLYAFASDGAAQSELGSILASHGVKVIGTPFEENLNKEGGVACATNLLPKNYDRPLDFLY